MDLTHEDGQNQTVFRPFMAVIGPELSQGFNGTAYVIRFYVDEPLRYHKRYDIRLLAEAVYRNVHHIESFSEYLMAEGEAGDDLPDYAYFVVLNHFFRHCISPLLSLICRNDSAGRPAYSVFLLLKTERCTDEWLQFALQLILSV